MERVEAVVARAVSTKDYCSSTFRANSGRTRPANCLMAVVTIRLAEIANSTVWSRPPGFQAHHTTTSMIASGAVLFSRVRHQRRPLQEFLLEEAVIVNEPRHRPIDKEIADRHRRRDNGQGNGRSGQQRSTGHDVAFHAVHTSIFFRHRQRLGHGVHWLHGRKSERDDSQIKDRDCPSIHRVGQSFSFTDQGFPQAFAQGNRLGLEVVAELFVIVVKESKVKLPGVLAL